MPRGPRPAARPAPPRPALAALGLGLAALLATSAVRTPAANAAPRRYGAPPLGLTSVVPAGAPAGPRAVDSRRRGRPKRPWPPPIVQPSARHHLTLLKIGDSLGEELGFGLSDVLGSNPNVTVLEEAVGDTGLARPDYYNWPAHLSQELAQYHPRVVVVLLGGDDGQNFDDHGRVVTFGSAQWRQVYSSRVATMMSEATAAGAHVVWVGLPIMSSAAFSSEMAQMNAIYAAQAARHRGVVFVATWSLFANAAGHYSATLPGPNGVPELMRNPDGVHFSGAGADRLAGAVVLAMERAWNVRL